MFSSKMLTVFARLDILLKICIILAIICVNNADECPGKNEYFSCGPECDNVCSELHIQNQTNCPIVNIQCNRKCYCENNYARDANGKCIPIDQCPREKVCGQHEEYTDCRKSCPPETCLSIFARFKCDAREECKPGCVCKSGFLRRNVHSPCIPISRCHEAVYTPN